MEKILTVSIAAYNAEKFIRKALDSLLIDDIDDVEIIVDPELEDESTVNINNYINKFILQCRICGNMFPSDEILKNETKCPVCGEVSNDGFILKGKLKKNRNEENASDDKEKAIDDLLSNDTNEIPITGDFDDSTSNVASRD